MTRDGSKPPAVPMETRRARVVAALGSHFVHDHVSLDELERRLDRAARVTTAAELDALIDDLPRLPVAEAVELGVYEVQRVDSVPESRRVVNVLGDFVRRGSWTVPRRMTVITLIGDVKMDFREALFGPEPVDLVIHQGLGDVELLVPPDVRVELAMTSIFGDTKETTEEPRALRPDSPVLRVTGTKLFSDLKIRELLPGEEKSGSEKKRRRRGRR